MSKEPVYVGLCGAKVVGVFYSVEEAVDKVAELAETTTDHVNTSESYTGDILCHQSNGYMLARLVPANLYG